MEAKTRVKRNVNPGNENVKHLSNKNTNQKDIDSKLRKCARGVSKRTALGSIANNAVITSNKNDPSKIDKGIIKNRHAGIVKKIEASKVLIGLKSKKVTQKKPETSQPKVTIQEPMQVERHDQEKIIFKLPEGVDNIDSECADDPQMCAENAVQIVEYLKQLEKAQAIKENFLSTSLITGKMRAVLVNWLAEVHLQFKLMQETLYLTVSIVDRYLSIEGHLVKRPKIQLVGVCAMLIACKYEEMYIPQVEDFVYITDEAYKSKEILSMELHMLNALKFEFGRPIAITFLRRNSKAGSVELEHHWVAKYILEACLVEYKLAHIAPSLMAAAALLLSLKLKDPLSKFEKLWNNNLKFYSGYKVDQLKSIIQVMASVVKDVHKSKYNAAYIKFNSSSNQKIASAITSDSVRMQMLENYSQGIF